MRHKHGKGKKEGKGGEGGKKINLGNMPSQKKKGFFF